MQWFGIFSTIFILATKVSGLVHINSSLEHEYDNGNTSVMITEEEFSKIGFATDLNSLIAKLGIELPKDDEFFPHESNDNVTSLRNFKNAHHQYISNPVQASCMPELTTVDLGLSGDGDLKFYPTCVRVNRCGGCCPSQHLLQCQPISTDKVIIKVIELASPKSHLNEVAPARVRRRVRVDIKSFNVTVEEHTSCSCMCILKEKDCNLELHAYDEVGCACTCKNRDDEAKCKATSSHIWDQKTCQCLCRNKVSCSSGQEFKHDTCMCESALGDRVSWDDLFLRSSNIRDSRRRKPISVPLDY